MLHHSITPWTRSSPTHRRTGGASGFFGSLPPAVMSSLARPVASIPDLEVMELRQQFVHGIGLHEIERRCGASLVGLTWASKGTLSPCPHCRDELHQLSHGGLRTRFILYKQCLQIIGRFTSEQIITLLNSEFDGISVRRYGYYGLCDQVQCAREGN